MKLLRLFATSFSLSLRQALAFRANLVFDAVLSVVALASTIATVLVIFSRTTTLAGWTRPEVLVLIGTFELLSGVKTTFVDPNLAGFPTRGVREGRLDHHLLQPAPSMFLVSFATAAPLAGVQILLGLGVVFAGAAELPRFPGAGAFSVWAVLVAAATVTTWAVGMIFASLAFWAPKLDLHSLFGNVWQLARYPADIYARPVRRVFTYVLPLAVVASAPARVLARPVDALLVLGALVTTAASVLVAMFVWRTGLRRYTGASS
ncbi:ABC transporter permease [Amycolatopsis sp. CA-161197]|uniref:ABC transporter permease n=1 Tax=Amycolatopsis sp. CA-161197 TaxID=3239922 RepID=UPI003D8B45BE